MKVIIAGTRTITNYSALKRTISMSLLPITEVVSGGCKGPDILGERWAKENNVKVTRFTADWDKFGKSAGPRRNTEMVEYVGKDGALILIWDGYSKGSSDILAKSIIKGLKVVECVLP